MTYQERIKELEKEIAVIKVKQHNSGMEGAAKELQKEVNTSSTKYEDKLYNIACLKGIKLKRQYRINIVRKKDKYIRRFYFVDFCDIINKIIIEVDGEYHNTKEQQKKDKLRTKDLCKEGYKVYRITNEEIEKGKTTQFLYNIYSKIKKKF